MLSQREKAADMGRPRINRMLDKIERIKQKKINSDNSVDLQQLDIAEDYFQKKVNRYNFLMGTTSAGYFNRNGNYHFTGNIEVVN